MLQRRARTSEKRPASPGWVIPRKLSDLIKVCSLNCGLFSIVCDAVDCECQSLVFHNEVCDRTFAQTLQKRQEITLGEADEEITLANSLQYNMVIQACIS